METVEWRKYYSKNDLGEILCFHVNLLQLGRQLHTVPLGHHTLGIECKGVLSTGVDRMLVGNRVGVGLTRSTISSFAPI